MRGIPFFIAVAGPVILILIQNLIVLVLVLRGIAQSREKKKAKQEKFASVRIAFACSVLLGTTWIFGVLAIGDLRDIFQWLFCIFNSLQGFFIFIFYCLRNAEARKSWGRFLGLKGFERGQTDRSKSNYGSSGKWLYLNNGIALELFLWMKPGSEFLITVFWEF